MVEGKGHTKDQIKAIQEMIAGFLCEQVINPNGEF